ncbi:MAG: metal ABC transporter permease, partial [Chlamydiia bacterium]|nr:metal ABC transporter permease [Chlamydiia bacterium]
MNFSIWDFFSHPLLRGPTFGTLFLCIASSLLGVVLFFQRRSLLSETLSHASWPGILLAVWFQSLIPSEGESSFSLFFSLGGGLFAWLGLQAVTQMEIRGKVPADTALTFVLASFFGIGTVITSVFQQISPRVYQEVQTLLFGQAAIMQDSHVLLYGVLALSSALFLFFSFRQVQLLLFDPQFALSSGFKVLFLEKLLIVFILASLILGIRGVGVLLISGMSIAPAIAARQFTDRLQTLFLLAALFGALSGLIGNWLSVFGTIALSQQGEKLTLPTGP